MIELTGSQAPLGNPRPRSSASTTGSQALPGTETQCAAYSDWLVDLSDGELPDDLREQVTAHVAQCDACRMDLARLDQSLARLTTGLSPLDCSLRPGSAGASPSGHLDRRIAAVLAIGLVCLLALTFALSRANRLPDSQPQATPVISQAEALRRIALLEQQARLQASLDLMPSAEWYDEQRAGNQRLLDRLKAITETTAHATKHESNGESL